MTNLTRKIATTATAVVIAAGLVAGFAIPAQAAPAGLPPIGPVRPGPSVPPLPPGFTIKPVVQFTSCTTQFLNDPSAYAFELIHNRPGTVGTVVPALARVLSASPRSATCTYIVDGARLVITTAAITPTQYRTLRTWYEANALAAFQVVPGVDRAGTASDFWVQVNEAVDGLPMENAMLSTDGWWITIYDGTGQWLPRLRDEATIRFLQVNPWRV